MPVALHELKTVYQKKRALLITDRTLYRNGALTPVEKLLDEIQIQHTAYFAVDKSAEMNVVQEGVKAAALFEPDVILAVGGSDVMHTAKLIRVLYEVPQADVAELSKRFGDIRSREVLFPRTDRKASLVIVPTASGTGEEVTPYATVNDGAAVYTIADYEVMPEFVVIDSDYMISQTREQIAAAAKTALAHLISAYESPSATEYTDGFVVKSMESIVRFLPGYLEKGADDPIGCEKLAEASAMSGIAYANTEMADAASVEALADKMLQNACEDQTLLLRCRDLAYAIGISGTDDKETVVKLIERIKALAALCG